MERKNTEASCSLDNHSCCSSEKDLSLKEHWENSYTKTHETKLGWYQKNAEPSLDLIKKTGIQSHELIADIGSGSSIFIDNLIERGFKNILATDISETALSITKKRLDKNSLPLVQFITDDLTNPTQLTLIKDIAVWHDRAVFHFLTAKKDRETYFNLLNSTVALGKFVIIAAFNLEGAQRCSGLPVERYDKNKIADFLGAKYKLIHFFNYNYTMPSGDNRPYIYTLFKKIG